MKLPPANGCAVCGNVTSKQCARCKMMKYCSEACQRFDWNSGHKSRCRDFRLSVKGNSVQSASTLQRRKSSFSISLVPSSGKTNIFNQSKKVLFPYEEFLEFFYWNSAGFPPCGLKNCGNSCYANVVLQCLTHTKPLVAYLLKKGHRRECRLKGWCFLCEFQLHVERSSRSREPFSPINILSRLPNIGGNLSCGKQEDAHEFMRFAINKMQLDFLDESGGEKAVAPSSQGTTLIEHIFGGCLQSQVTCTKCSNRSNQFENMMDLTVEIHGDAESLEECLHQFTRVECMDGENMYKCDRCNDYVKAWKRLVIWKAPNILTIVLKRFQKGRFGKLNKRVIFSAHLDLCPNMSEFGDGNAFFELYAVIVHVNTVKASDFGHYICYIQDLSESWYRIEDDMVDKVDVHEVLLQEAYMLLYRRIKARPTSLYPLDSFNREDYDIVKAEGKQHSPLQPLECHKTTVSPGICANSGSFPTDDSSEIKVVRAKEELSSITYSEGGKEDQDMVDPGASRYVSSAAEAISCLAILPPSSFINSSAEAAEAISSLRMLPRSVIDSSAEAVMQKPEGRFLVSDIEEKTETSEGTTDESLLEYSSRDSIRALPSSSFSSIAEAVMQTPEGRSPVSDIKEKTETSEGTTGESLSESSSGDSVATNGEMEYDASGSAYSSSSSGVYMEFDNSILSPMQAEYEKEFSSHDIHDVSLKKDEGTFPGEKLEPLFVPGLSVKIPHNNRCAIPEITGEVCLNSSLSGPTNACAETVSSCEIHGAVGNEQKPSFESPESSKWCECTYILKCPLAKIHSLLWPIV